MTAGGLALFQEIMFNDTTKKLLAPLADATEKDPIRLDDAMFYRGNQNVLICIVSRLAARNIHSTAHFRDPGLAG